MSCKLCLTEGPNSAEKIGSRLVSKKRLGRPNVVSLKLVKVTNLMTQSDQIRPNVLQNNDPFTVSHLIDSRNETNRVATSKGGTPNASDSDRSFLDLSRIDQERMAQRLGLKLVTN